MSQLSCLTSSTNSIQVKDMMVQLFKTDNERHCKLVRETYVMCQELIVHCQERQEQLMEMQRFLSGSNVVFEYFNLLKDLQDDELGKSKEMMKLIIARVWLCSLLLLLSSKSYLKVPPSS
ncbi:hypothetical protein Tco_1186710 [Tanacetum coccineum]